MNWNKTLFPARSILIGWPTIRDTGASPGLIQARAGLPNVAPPNISPIRAAVLHAPTVGRDVNGYPDGFTSEGRITRLIASLKDSKPDISSAASLLAKAGAAKRAETAKAKRDRVHAELGAK